MRQKNGTKRLEPPPRFRAGDWAVYKMGDWRQPVLVVEDRGVFTDQHVYFLHAPAPDGPTDVYSSFSLSEQFLEPATPADLDNLGPPAERAARMAAVGGRSRWSDRP